MAIQPVQDKGTVEITPAQGRGELQPGQKQDVVDLAVNMDVDGIHPSTAIECRNPGILWILKIGSQASRTALSH